jgi:hypothetical protein
MIVRWRPIRVCGEYTPTVTVAEERHASVRVPDGARYFQHRVQALIKRG